MDLSAIRPSTYLPEENLALVLDVLILIVLIVLLAVGFGQLKIEAPALQQQEEKAEEAKSS